MESSEVKPHVTGSGPDTIDLIYTEREDFAGQKGLFGPAREAVTRIGELDLSALSENLTTFCARVGDVIDTARASVGAYQLDRFELTLDVGIKGEVRLVGAVGAEAHGGLKLVFRRGEPSDE